MINRTASAASVLCVWLAVFLMLFARAGEPELAYTIGDRGLTSLTYDGFDFVPKTIWHGFRGYCVKQLPENGPAIPDKDEYSSGKLADGGQAIDFTFEWGRVTLKYVKVSRQRLDLDFTVTNARPNPLQAPLLIGNFAVPPKARYYAPEIGWSNEAGGTVSFQRGSPAVMIDLAGKGRMAWTVAPGSNYAEFSAGLAHGDGNNTVRCFLDLSSIPPGTSKRGILSLRFGPATASILDLAGDAYQRHDTWAPFQFDWPDRRAIGRIFLAEPPPHPADGKNPRGWCQNNDHDLKAEHPWSRDINVIDPKTGNVDPGGYPKFREEMLKAVDAKCEASASQPWYFASDKPMQGMNLQGIIVWDIEGTEFPHTTTYVGEPRQIDRLAPEMTYVPEDQLANSKLPDNDPKKYRCVADEIFWRIKHTSKRVDGKPVPLNLRTGVCLRPQTLQNLAVKDNPGKPEMEHYPKWWLVREEVPLKDIPEKLLQEIAYANRRWGCTLFYIDSTGNEKGVYPGLSIFPQLRKKLAESGVENVLLMGENQDPHYYAFGAPYDESPLNGLGTPASIIDLYQGAFSTWAIPNGWPWKSKNEPGWTVKNLPVEQQAETQRWYNALVLALKRGDIAFVDPGGWWAMPDFIMNAYAEVGARPTISITSPKPGTSFSAPGPVTMAATASCEGKQISKVEFFAGPVKIGEATTAPYTFTWKDYQGNLDYNLYAKAWMPDGCTAVASPVGITVKDLSKPDAEKSGRPK